MVRVMLLISACDTMLVFVTFGLDKVIKEELRFHLPILFLIVPWTMHTFTSFIERMNGILFGEG